MFSKWAPQGSWMGFQGVPQQKGELVLIPNVPTKPETAHKLCPSLKGNLYLYQILNAALVLIMNYAKREKAILAEQKLTLFRLSWAHQCSALMSF